MFSNQSPPSLLAPRLVCLCVCVFHIHKHKLMNHLTYSIIHPKNKISSSLPSPFLLSPSSPLLASDPPFFSHHLSPSSFLPLFFTTSISLFLPCSQPFSPPFLPPFSQISGQGRDNLLELLIQFITRSDGLGWSIVVVDTEGIQRLLTIAGILCLYYYFLNIF